MKVKKLRVKLQKECDCRDGGGNHDSWLQGKRGDISLTGQGQDDKTYKLWWSWPKPLEDKLIINYKILNQDEVFHIMDSITRDRQECYVVRNSSVRLENFYQLSLFKFLRGPSFKVNDRYCGWLQGLEGVIPKHELGNFELPSWFQSVDRFDQEHKLYSTTKAIHIIELF